MKNTFFCLTIILSLGLTGCTGVNSEFSCNATAGDTCVPVEKINERASKGAYQDGAANVTTKNTIYKNSYESSKKVWIEASIDDKGVYHRGRFVAFDEQ